MTPQKIPTWKLERYVAQDLPSNQMQEVAQLIAVDPQLQQQVADLQAQNQSFLIKHPFEEVQRRARLETQLPHIQEQQIKEERGTTPLWKPLLSMFTLLLVIGLILPQGFLSGFSDDGIRTKGMEDRLELWQKTGDSAALLLDGAHVQAGDRIQVRLKVHETRYVAVLSLDGNGNWTQHYPEKSTQAVLLNANEPLILPYAYELDNAPRFECFWMLSSKEPFSIQDFSQLNVGTDRDDLPTQLGLPGTIDQQHLTLLKGTQP